MAFKKERITQINHQCPSCGMFLVSKIKHPKIVALMDSLPEEKRQWVIEAFDVWEEAAQYLFDRQLENWSAFV